MPNGKQIGEYATCDFLPKCLVFKRLFRKISNLLQDYFKLNQHLKSIKTCSWVVEPQVVYTQKTNTRIMNHLYDLKNGVKAK